MPHVKFWIPPPHIWIAEWKALIYQQIGMQKSFFITRWLLQVVFRVVRNFRLLWYFLQGDFDAGYLYLCKFWTDEERARRPEEERNRDEPLRAIPVSDSKDVPISVIKYR